MLSHFAEAAGLLLDPGMILLILIATAVGTIGAVVPGVTAGLMMALLIPVTFGMELNQAAVFMATLMGAGGFAGSVTSILVNIPGDGVNAATTLDGYPLARSGKAGVAIGASATASALGALFGILVLIASLPFLRTIVLAFGPPEFFAITVAGIVLIGSVSGDSPYKGIVSGLIGMAVGFVGVNFVVGGTRYTFGRPELAEGVGLIAALIGMFAIPELYKLLRRDESVSRDSLLVAEGVFEGVKEVLRRPWLLIRSSAIGTGVGIIPGVGGSVASWVAYSAAAASSRDPTRFGKGAIEGVIAPEAANDAKDGGSLVPALALGIPGSFMTALLLTALHYQGVFPGPRFFETQQTLIWLMILALLCSNFITSALGLCLANQLVKITLVPGTVLAPVVLSIAAVGAFAGSRRLSSLIVMGGFGMLGIVMGKYGYPRAPFLVGLILLPICEVYFHQSIQIHRGTYAFLQNPLVIAIFSAIVLVLLLPKVFGRIRRRHRRLREGSPDVVSPVEVHEDSAQTEGAHFTLGHVAFVTAILAVASWMFWSAFGFSPRAGLFPKIVLGVLVLLSAGLLLSLGLQYRKTRRFDQPPAETSAHPPLWILASFLALPFLMWGMGPIWGAGVFVALFQLGFKRRRLPPRRVAGALIGGICVAAMLHFTFVVVMGMRL